MSTFNKEELLSIADEIYCQSIIQSDVFIKMQTTNPEIVAKEAELNEQLAKVQAAMGKEFFNKLSNLICEASNAYIDPCILYGMKVQQAMTFAENNPHVLMEHIKNRVEKKRNIA